MIEHTDISCPLPQREQAKECSEAMAALPDEARKLFGALYELGMIEGGRSIEHIEHRGGRLYWDGITYDPHDLRDRWRGALLSKPYDLTRKLTKLNAPRLARTINTEHGPALVCKYCKTIVLTANLPHSHRCIFLSDKDPADLMDSATVNKQK